MILRVHNNATYLSKPEAKNRVGGHYYLSNNHIQNAPDNRAIMIIVKLQKNIMSSAKESEIASIFHNAKEIAPLRTTLEEIGHKQPPTLIQTDSKTGDGILNNKVKQ